MSCEELRNQLFESYFEVEGIQLLNLICSLKPVIDSFKQLHILLEKNVKHFDKYSNLYEIKKIEHNSKYYLIVKSNLWQYLIIDLEDGKSLNKEDVINLFNEKFFIDNFKEKNTKNNFTNMYNFMKYSGNIAELICFYEDNKKLLELPKNIRHSIKLGEAVTYLNISLSKSEIQLGFHTPNQSLYEHLFLDIDFNPYSIQDAKQRIGNEKMLEMFERIKNIKIPKYNIPKEFFEIQLIGFQKTKSS